MEKDKKGDLKKKDALYAKAEATLKTTVLGVRKNFELRMIILGETKAQVAKKHGIEKAWLSSVLHSSNITLKSLEILAEMSKTTSALLLRPIEGEEVEEA